MNKVYGGLKNVVDSMVSVIFAAMVIIVFMQVIMRYVFNHSLTWADESSRFLFIWLVYLGGSITVRTGKMVCFDLLLEACRGKMWKIMQIAVTAICVVFLAFVAIWGVKSLTLTAGEFSPVLGVPMVAVKAIIPIGSLLMIMEQVFHMMEHWDDKDKEKEEADAEEVAEL